jgi:hypothetical protein
MGAIVFDNMQFDYWLTQKSQEILSKADKEKITTEDLIILTLKAQTNHFHHMDIEFRDEFKKIDKKFDRLYSALMWGFGLMLTMTFGLYIKLFLG